MMDDQQHQYCNLLCSELLVNRIRAMFSCNINAIAICQLSVADTQDTLRGTASRQRPGTATSKHIQQNDESLDARPVKRGFHCRCSALSWLHRTVRHLLAVTLPQYGVLMLTPADNNG